MTTGKKPERISIEGIDFYGGTWYGTAKNLRKKGLFRQVMELDRTRTIRQRLSGATDDFKELKKRNGYELAGQPAPDLMCKYFKEL